MRDHDGIEPERVEFVVADGGQSDDPGDLGPADTHETARADGYDYDVTEDLTPAAEGETWGECAERLTARRVSVGTYAGVAFVRGVGVGMFGGAALAGGPLPIHPAIPLLMGAVTLLLSTWAMYRLDDRKRSHGVRTP